MTLPRSWNRGGMTLLEVFVVMAIIGVLIALLIPAISTVRETALRTRSSNQLRQLGLAVHQVADLCQGYVGSASPHERPIRSSREITKDASPIHAAACMAEGRFSADIRLHYHTGPEGNWAIQFPILLSPADPSLLAVPQPIGFHLTSYSWNFQLFSRNPKFPVKVHDGTSQTIMFAERYVQTGTGQATQTTFVADFAEPPFISPLNNQPLYYTNRRATFADSVFNDVHPVVTNPTAGPHSSRPGAFIQVRPSVETADCHVLQTPYSSGLLVGYADGSVRTIAANVSDRLFWTQVTPDAGDVPPPE